VVEEPCFRVEVDDVAGCIRLIGELDLASCEALPDAILGCGHSTVDCSELTFLDASGIRAFAIAHVATEKQGDRLVFVGVQGTPRRVIEITGMDGVLHLV
jgi:anti-anti-sigma factor